MKLSERSFLERKEYVGSREQLLQKESAVEVSQERNQEAEQVSVGWVHDEQKD